MDKLDFYCKEIILNILLENHLNVDNIANKTKLSIRQVEYRIDQINNILLDNYNLNLNYIKNNSPINSILFDALKDILNTNHFQNLTKDERQKFIILSIFCNYSYLSMNDLIYWLSISKSVIMSDLKDIKDELTKYGITITNSKSKGYFIQSGHFNALTYLFREMIIKNSKYQRIIDYYLTIQHKNELVKLRNLIFSLESKYQIKFVGSRIDEFIYLINILIINQDYHYFNTINKNELLPVTQLDEFNLITVIQKELNIQFPENVSIYLAACLIGASFGDYEVHTKDREIIADITKNVMSRFQYVGCLNYDNYDDVFIRLYSHLRPALYRIIYHIPIYNPLAEQVIKEYNHFFILVKEALKPIQHLFDLSFSNDEIAYLIMHFQTILFDKKSKNIYSHNCAIICDAGIGTSIMLKSQLEDLFPEFNFTPLSYKTINNLSDFNNNFDIIFTTIGNLAINFKDLPIFYTPALLNKVDKYNLSKKVYEFIGDSNNHPSSLIVHEIINLIGKFAIVSSKSDLRNELVKFFVGYNISKDVTPVKLKELLLPHYIKKVNSVLDWQEAIQLAGEILLHPDVIKKVTKKLM